MRVLIPKDGVYSISWTSRAGANYLWVNSNPIQSLFREDNMNHTMTTIAVLQEGDLVEGYGLRVYLQEESTLMHNIRQALDV